MKIHPKQIIPAIKHISSHWPNGCLCSICRGVDNQEKFVVLYKEFREKNGKEKEQ